MSNANVTINYNLAGGTADFYWQGSEKITGFYAAVSNAASCLVSTNYPVRTWFASGAQAVVTNSGGGRPLLLQYFTLDQTDSFLTSVSLAAATNLQSNWMMPLGVNATGGVNLGVANDNRALFVPFDNDHSVSYNSESMNGSDTGNEVGAFYDNVSRNGLVVGSVTHDTWKTGVSWSGGNNKLNQLSVFGGVTSYWTWDVMPHGAISGQVISSPVIFAGFGNDWRTVMEHYADENALVVPRLTWTNGIPFGWNSWGVTNYQGNLSDAAALAVAASIHTNLQVHGFTNGGTVYVNLDSYWDNLWTDYGGSELQAFVAQCHANGQKAGIYFTPFTFWGNANDATNYWVPVGCPPNYNLYRFSDILLRDANGNFIANDGGLAIDPTHPGTRGYIDYYTYWFHTWGFDYVKLDFLSHGSLEGMHYDPAVTTGMQAYNQGMQYLLNDLGAMFVSESISPIFPYQYAHSRRIACDAEASKISNTAYTMNAVSCGWWISGRLYQYNDPDVLVFDNGPTTNEAQSRLINGVVTGLFLNGSILTNAASISLAQMCLTNAAINDVAAVGRTFRPVDGATGTGAANIVERQDGMIWRLGVFNYTGNPTNETVSLANAGLPAGTYAVTDLWSGAVSSATGLLSVSLNAKQAKLFSLAELPLAPSLVTPPAAYTNALPVYAGVPVSFSVTPGGSAPFLYQWYEVIGGVTNAIAGATNASLTHWLQGDDDSGSPGFFVAITNAYGGIVSPVALLAVGRVVTGTPDTVSVQYTLTNYAGYAGGFQLAPTDTAGVYGVSNWNVFSITPAGGGAGTQLGVTTSNLLDRFGVVTPLAVNVVNVSDGWHQTAQTITGLDTANARLMNTFWKTHNDSSPATNVLYMTFTNVPNGVYSAYIYLLQNNAGATGYVYGTGGATNYFQEMTAFTSASNFVTAVDTAGTVNPYVNYLKLTGLATGGTDTLTITTVWTGGADGLGVCGIQLVPPPLMDAMFQANDQFSLRFPAPDNQSYIVDMTTNLMAWTPVATNSPVNGQFVFVNTNAAFGRQFYRVRQ